MKSSRSFKTPFDQQCPVGVWSALVVNTAVYCSLLIPKTGFTVLQAAGTRCLSPHYPTTTFWTQKTTKQQRKKLVKTVYTRRAFLSYQTTTSAWILSDGGLKAMFTENPRKNVDLDPQSIILANVIFSDFLNEYRVVCGVFRWADGVNTPGKCISRPYEAGRWISHYCGGSSWLQTFNNPVDNDRVSVWQHTRIWWYLLIQVSFAKTAGMKFFCRDRKKELHIFKSTKRPQSGIPHTKRMHRHFSW